MFFRKLRTSITEYQCAMHKLANQVCSLREEVEELKAELKSHVSAMNHLERKIEITGDAFIQLEEIAKEMTETTKTVNDGLKKAKKKVE